MRILLTTISLSSKTGGGTAERTRRLARHLAAQGHRCMLATMEDGDLADELRSAGMPVYASPAIKLRFRVPLIRPDRLAEAVRSADAIHILGYWNLLSVATAFTATRFRKPYAFSAAGEFVGLERPRPIARAFHVLLGRFMLRNAGLIVAITPLERMQIIQRLGLAPNRVVVVPNGVEPSPSPSSGAAVALPDEPFILFVGRLAEVKGPDLLLKAFAAVAAAHPDVALVMAGPDFGMGAQLRQEAARRGLERRVLFTGHLGEADRTAAYRRALFLVVPSRAEAMSLVAVEAGAAGTPVLLTDRCGFDEVETLGGGQVVPATVEGLRDGLSAMLSRRSTLPQVGERLRLHVERSYIWTSIVAQLACHLKFLVEGASGEGTTTFAPSPPTGDDDSTAKDTN
ncbi:glycosyltransferase family 4 protein [Bradyrhizobium barranii subsp. barranii]|uniref:Glycosyltransferase family 4 protein n=1 Tax=Bradyrhizobium barranii subsp. barranii TaxID=2823807 RepID=A0A7Z0QD18_9BRAD|nr:MULTISPECIES: glycosyltransferase family 4 protein [Bradyrhizobium]UEM17952.1 glycosyltransferase family 4 protein [Bradyrhizobium barranii subsp. barranii]UGX91769.1 glycosyltransferase family 4 protein [Bradyrhizobium barranii subsp. barranii]UQE03599.1 glycosyltransferase family 4 protein [Bradyrhizobium japonicum]